MSKQHSKEERRESRELYLRSRGGDLTSYAAMLGDSFALKIDSLAQIIGDAHDPSIGIYKERLLKKTISELIPKRYDVATGLVLFPKSVLPDVGQKMEAPSEDTWRYHEVSKQLDLVIYDSYNYPVLFQDEDFVVLRPESVRAIIEVKGALKPREVRETVDLFVDYARKWKSCRSFYAGRGWPMQHQSSQRALLQPPGMFLMAWATYVDPQGYPAIDGKRLREQIVNLYRTEVSKNELPAFPLLRAAYIYSDCKVQAIWQVPEDALEQYGYATTRGYLVRYCEDGQPEKTGDGTIASLLAGIQWCLETPFNPSFAYVDQERRLDVFPHEHEGFEPWLEGEDLSLVAPKNFEE